jgi:hypothetical protein
MDSVQEIFELIGDGGPTHRREYCIDWDRIPEHERKTIMACRPLLVDPHNSPLPIKPIDIKMSEVSPVRCIQSGSGKTEQPPKFLEYELQDRQEIIRDSITGLVHWHYEFLLPKEIANSFLAKELKNSERIFLCDTHC